MLEKTEPQNLPLVSVSAGIAIRAAQSEPDQALTFDVTYSTGAGVPRYDYARDRRYIEELEVSASAIDASRIEAGAPFLNTHGAYSLEDVLGVCSSPGVSNGLATCSIRMSSRPEIASIRQDIRDGILPNVSVGYIRQAIEMVAPENEGGMWRYVVKRWQPIEVSLVPIPADAGAQIRSASGEWATADGKELRSFPCEIWETRQAEKPTAGRADHQPKANKMPTTQSENTAENVTTVRTMPTEDAAAIITLCARHGQAEKAADYIRANASVDTVRKEILDGIAAADSQGGTLNARGIQTVKDEQDVRAAGIAEALLSRVDGTAKITDNGRRFRSFSLIEMARASVEGMGIRTSDMSKMELAGVALTHRASTALGFHSTSDFPGLLSALANKRLRNSYQENLPSYRMWARRAPNAPDFKNINAIALGNAPDLLRVNEAAEFTYGTIAEASEVYSAITYGRIVSLTRQALINDDLRAFDRIVTAFGASSNRLENRLAYANLTANANMADGNALFSAAHLNNATGGGSALTAASLTTGRTAMRVQKGLATEELNLTPRYLIVPAALEQTAYQLTSSQYVPATVGAINEFRAGGRTAVEPIIEAVLDASSATAWYLAAGNDQIDTVEYCYVDGSEGPVIEQQMGFEVDGMQFKCRLDFATKAIDWRGMYRAVGV